MPTLPLVALKLLDELRVQTERAGRVRSGTVGEGRSSRGGKPGASASSDVRSATSFAGSASIEWLKPLCWMCSTNRRTGGAAQIRGTGWYSWVHLRA